MPAPVPTWGIDMQLKQKALDAVQEARDRIVVVGGSSVSLKIVLISLLVTFGLGFYTATRWDFSGYRKFRAEMAELKRKKEEENARLVAELEVLRKKLAEELAVQDRHDAAFDKLLNKPGSRSCLVPVEEINPIIAEAGR